MFDDLFEFIMKNGMNQKKPKTLQNCFFQVLVFSIFLFGILAKIVWKNWHFVVKFVKKKKEIYFVVSENFVWLKMFLKSARTSKVCFFFVLDEQHF